MMKSLALTALLCLLTAAASAGTVTGRFAYLSGLPVVNGTITFTPSQAAYAAGSYALVASPVSCYTTTDGSVVGVVDPQIAPTATPSSGNGTLATGTYYVSYTYASASGETLTSPELAITVGTSGALEVNPPTIQPPAAVGYNVYVGTQPSMGTLQGSVTGWTSFQLTALATGNPAPTANNTLCSIVFNDAVVPTNTTYAVSVLDSHGSALAGWPQNIRFWGQNAIDISTISPTGNTAGVYFPSAILSLPSGHATQSINGPLSLSGYNLSNVGNITGLASLTAGSINGVINAAQSSGADIGAKIDAAIATLGGHGRVMIPAGVYPFATRINVPRGILIDGAGPGSTSLVWTGSGVAIYSGDSNGAFAAQNGGIGNLELTTSGTRPAGTIGIYSGGDPNGVISPTTDIAQSQTFINLKIDNFDIAFKHGNNSFWLTFVAPRIAGNNIGFTVDPAFDDTGEGINFFGGAIDDNLQGAFVNDPLNNHLYGVGIDFNGNMGTVPQVTNSSIEADRCNWEVHTGAQYSGSYLKIIGGQMLIDQASPSVAAMVIANQTQNQIAITGLNVASAAPVTDFLSWSNGGDPYSLLALTNMTGNHNGLIAALYDNLPANKDVDIQTSLGPVGASGTNRPTSFAGGLSTTTLTAAGITASGTITANALSATSATLTGITATGISTTNLTVNGGAQWITGAGVPSGACTNGSLYTRTDAATGTTELYICAAAAWIAK